MNLIILTSFNCKYEYPFECLRSIWMQKYDNDVSIIILDDGSEKDEDYQKFERMVNRTGANLITLSERKGQAYARLKLIEEAKSIYNDKLSDSMVMFLDGDDTLSHKEALEDIRRKMEPDIDFVFGWMNGWDQQRYKPDFSPSTIRSIAWACTPPRVIRGSVLASVEFDEAMFTIDGKWLSSATDQALMFEIIEQVSPTIDKIAYVDRPSMNYRIHPGCGISTREKHQNTMQNEKIVRGKQMDFYKK